MQLKVVQLTIIGCQFAPDEASFKVLNPEMCFQAHLSPYTVATLRIFNPFEIL
jgi:hypothetical protein